MNEKISIIMPTFNVESFVGDAIESIINQSYKNWELIITDDFSTDNTWVVINDYSKKDDRIRVYQLEKNSGAGTARNNSIKYAQGRYIAFCDSDDWWYPYKLEIQYNFLVENNYEFIFSACEFTNSNLEITGISWKRLKIDKRILLYECNVGTPGVIYDTKRIGKVYFHNIRKRQDWVMWLNLIEKTGSLHCINWPLWKCRIRDNSLTSNKFSLVKYNLEVYNSVIGFSKIKSFFYFFFAYMPDYFYRKFKDKRDSRIYLKSYFHKTY
jgi:glycosyltransferase involved in cell wall biosynthesis